MDEDEEAMEFKLLKYKLMLLIVNDIKKWSVSLPPRDADPESTSIPMDDGINQLVSTCRLLGLSHRDYDGTATKVLREKIKEIEEAKRNAPNDFDGDSYDLVMKKDGKGLELACWCMDVSSVGRGSDKMGLDFRGRTLQNSLAHSEYQRMGICLRSLPRNHFTRNLETSFTACDVRVRRGQKFYRKCKSRKFFLQK